MPDLVLPEITEFEKMLKRAERLANAAQVNTTYAFIAAAMDPSLKIFNMNGDEADFSGLEDSEKVKSLADRIHEAALGYANKFYAAGTKPEDRLKSDGLLRAYNGTTYGTTAKLLAEQKGNMSIKVWEAYRDQALQPVSQSLKTSAAGVLTDTHTVPLITYMKLDDVVDSSKMRINDAINVVLMNEESKRVNKAPLTAEQLKRIFAEQRSDVPIYIKG